MEFFGKPQQEFEPRTFSTSRPGPRPARPSRAPTAEHPAPHACATRLAVLSVCCWEWRCGGSTWRCCEQPPCGTPCGTPEQVKRFRGPCAACCKPLAPCCCVSADGEAIFGCVLTDRKYFLPACLHMALCPQLGCDPRGGNEELDYCCEPLIGTLFFTPFVLCFQEPNPFGVW